MNDIRISRACRRAGFMLAALVAVLAVVEASVWHVIAVALAQCLVAAALLGMACLLGRDIRHAERELRRPDYARIASLERELFGGGR